MVIEPPIEKLRGGESENLLEDAVNKHIETTTCKMVAYRLKQWYNSTYSG